MLHKDLTFTGRTYIWDYVLKLIEKRKIIGYGLEDSNFRLSKSTIWQSYHAHDQFLEITYKGGIVGLIIYIMILLKSFKKVYSLRMYKISKFISIVIFSYLIMMLTEFYAFDTYMYIFIFCYNIDCLIKGDQL